MELNKLTIFHVSSAAGWMPAFELFGKFRKIYGGRISATVRGCGRSFHDIEIGRDWTGFQGL